MGSNGVNGAGNSIGSWGTWDGTTAYYPLNLDFGDATHHGNVNFSANGNVGIGTTNPDAGAKLTVSGGILATAPFLATTGSTAGMDYYAGELRLFAIGISGATKGAYQFIAKGADNSETIPMTIDSNGNVGIGTTDPTVKLEVAGKVKITGGSPTTGGALCLNTSGVVSKCTTAIDSSGNCTCP